MRPPVRSRFSSKHLNGMAGSIDLHLMTEVKFFWEDVDKITSLLRINGASVGEITVQYKNVNVDKFYPRLVAARPFVMPLRQRKCTGHTTLHLCDAVTGHGFGHRIAAAFCRFGTITLRQRDFILNVLFGDHAPPTDPPTNRLLD